MGLHPFGDPAIVDDFGNEELRIDVREFHRYAAQWAPGRVEFSVDGRPIRSARQAPDYPMQLMLGIYEFPDAAAPAGRYPKELVVDYVRGSRMVRQGGAAPLR